MRSLFINLPFYRFMNSTSLQAPPGLCYLAAVARQSGFDVSVYDSDFDKTSSIESRDDLKDNFDQYKKRIHDPQDPIYREIENKIVEISPDVVGATVWTAAYPAIKIISEKIKLIDEDIIIAAGGPHPSSAPGDLVENTDIDIEVRGEGEKVIVNLLRSIQLNEGYEKVKGILFKENGKRVRTPDEDFISNLDEIPYPAKDLLIDRPDNPEYYGRIMSSRGCPFHCIFCDSHQIWGRKTRFRGPENVVGEIQEVVQKYGTKHFTFSDDTFTVDKERVKNFCRLLLEKKLGITWECGTRVNAVDRDLLAKMKEAGCVHVRFGIEAGNQKMLKRIKKGITVEQTKNALQMAKLEKLKTSTYFMVGHPGETVEDINDTIKLMKKLDPDIPYVNIVSPYPGTELWDIVQRENTLEISDWSDLFHQSRGSVGTGVLSREEVYRQFERVQKEFKRHRRRKMFNASFILNKLRNIRNFGDMKQLIIKAGRKIR